MKMLILALAFIATTASAGEVMVLNIPVLGYQEVKSAVFNFNKDLGRAWVEVVVDDVMPNPDSDSSDFYRQKVSGLAYDASTGLITLDHEGQIIECAAVVTKGRGIFRQTVVKNRNCAFESKTVTVDWDNGFEIVKRKRLKVFLVTK